MNDKLDMLLYAWERNVATEEAAAVLGLPDEAVKRVFRDFSAKHKATAHLRALPAGLA